MIASMPMDLHTLSTMEASRRKAFYEQCAKELEANRLETLRKAREAQMWEEIRSALWWGFVAILGVVVVAFVW